MAGRDLPYGAFNFVVKINGTEMFGGFSDISGLSTEMVAAEYRTGHEQENHVRKVPGLHKVGDVTLKRGVINSADLWQWINEVRTQGPSAKRTVVIQMLAEDRVTTVQQWTLTQVMPLKYTAPTFAAKGSGDVAIEELVLSSEGMYMPAPQ